MSSTSQFVWSGISILLALGAVCMGITTLTTARKVTKIQSKVLIDYRTTEDNIVPDSLWEDKTYGSQWYVTDVDGMVVKVRPLYKSEGGVVAMRMTKGFFLENYEYHGMMYWDSDSFLDSLADRG